MEFKNCLIFVVKRLKIHRFWSAFRTSRWFAFPSLKAGKNIRFFLNMNYYNLQQFSEILNFTEVLRLPEDDEVAPFLLLFLPSRFFYPI